MIDEDAMSWRENDPSHVEEVSVGIELYANSAAGFEGVLKERFSDFVVREIDPVTNEPVKLTELKPLVDEPIDARERAKFESMRDAVRAEEARRGLSADDATTNEAEDGEDVIDESAMKEFEEMCGKEEADRLRAFLETPGVMKHSQKKLAKGVPLPAPLVLAPTDDKAQRTKIHQFFKRHFFLPTDNVIESISQEKKALKNLQKPRSSVRVNPAEKQGKKRSRVEAMDHRAGGNFWPDGVPEHVRFVFCKENKESYEMLNVIARALKVHFNSLGVAGTKDKRGVTCQHVTVHRIRAKRLAKLVLYGCKIGNYEYVDNQLGFGDHSGNEFEIVLRGVDPSAVENVERAVQSLESSGTINYYGLQRFGNYSTTGGTHQIGMKLLRGEWQDAIDTLLLPREGERADVAAARAKWVETKDPAATLKILPRWCSAERSILERMTKVRSTDLVGCLLAVPRQIRLMYIHAYQAYVFNRVVSARIRKYGVNTVVEGDIVLEEDECIENDENLDDLRVNMPKVHVVTAEEAAAGTFDSSRVVLPLPGNAVIYPTNLGDIYNEIASENGISHSEQKHAVREFSITSFTGDYRRCFLKPTHVSHEVISYADQKADLVLTDLDRVQGTTEREIESGPLRAAKVKFRLPPSSYATMVLRELMKSNTSVASHKSKTKAALAGAD